MFKLILLSSSLLTLFVFSIIWNSNEFAMGANLDKNGKVSGSILDRNNAVIILPQPQIRFESLVFQKTVSVDADGIYEVALPPGIYSVKLDIKGYHPLTRSMIKVEAEENYALNLVPTPIYLTLGTSLYEKDSVDRLATPPKYETLFQNDKFLSDIKPVIQYQAKSQLDNGLEYEDVILSYNFVTIYADKMFYKKSENILESTGKNLVVENAIDCPIMKKIKVKSIDGDVSFELICD